MRHKIVVITVVLADLILGLSRAYAGPVRTFTYTTTGDDNGYVSVWPGTAATNPTPPAAMNMTASAAYGFTQSFGNQTYSLSAGAIAITASTFSINGLIPLLQVTGAVITSATITTLTATTISGIIAGQATLANGWTTVTLTGAGYTSNTDHACIANENAGYGSTLSPGFTQSTDGQSMTIYTASGDSNIVNYLCSKNILP